MNKQSKTLQQMSPPNDLKGMLEYLNLRTIADNYQNILNSSAKENISHEEFLTKLVSLESSSKFERQVNARITCAKFPVIKTLEQFDFNHPSGIQKQKIM